MWIGIGAVLTGVIISVFPDLPLAWQSLAFAATMLASVGLGLVLQRRSRADDAARHLNRELAAMVGQRYRALTDFEAGRGRIQLGDSSYAALGEAPIAAGEIVEVVAIEDGRPRVARRPQSV